MGEENFYVEGLQTYTKDANEDFDDDGRPKRTGNLWCTVAHIITAIIGSGVLSLAWGVAQLGWIAGGATLLLFSIITLYTSNLLADCYRYPDPITGKRNQNYSEAVQAYLGEKMFIACGFVQYVNLCGMAIGYTITASISMVAVQKSNCFHREGHSADHSADAHCKFSHNWYMIGMGVVEVFLSQIPNFHKLSILSFIAAIMSFSYSLIGISLSFAKIVSGKGNKTSLTGVPIGTQLSSAQRTWKMFSGLGDIVLAFSFALVLIEIQDTLRSSKPENKVMKKANNIGISITSLFYIMCGCFGYAALGDQTPGNLISGFGFFEPYWLIDFANLCIVLHLVGAYQTNYFQNRVFNYKTYFLKENFPIITLRLTMFAQPIFSVVEAWAHKRWPKSEFVTKEYPIEIIKNYTFNANLLRLTWRTVFVILATLLAAMFPFFNEILGLLGAIQYWPLQVFFPVAMHISQNKIRKGSTRWLGLQLLNIICFFVALAAASGSIQGIKKALNDFKLFQFKN